MASNKGWSANKDVWGDIPNEINKGRWKKFKATKNSLNLVPEKPGIYMFCASHSLNSINLETPFYIGKAKDLKRRYKDHLRDNNKVKHLKVCFGSKLEFCFLALKDNTSNNVLRLYEQSMIDCFGPQFNEIDSVAQLSPLKATLGKKTKF